MSRFPNRQDPEAQSILLSLLGRAKELSAVPLLARVLRDPASRNGDTHWAAVEALSALAGQQFPPTGEGLRAADAWLTRQGF